MDDLEQKIKRRHMFFIDKHDVVKNVGKKSKDQEIIDRVNGYHYTVRKPIWPWVILAITLTLLSLFVR